MTVEECVKLIEMRVKIAEKWRSGGATAVRKFRFQEQGRPLILYQIYFLKDKLKLNFVHLMLNKRATNIYF